MVQILAFTGGKVIAAKARKTLVPSDYYKLLPLFVNCLKQYPNIRLCLDVSELEGIDLQELHEDLHVNAGLASAIDKVALLGRKKDEPWMNEMLKYFSSADLKWFEPTEAISAVAWLKTERKRINEFYKPLRAAYKTYACSIG
ncbi:MAG TPA: STAS/SEC14 domain-containing protein [Cyclobacteriaceae bacterium]|nr:STAS/SEC14 domain-containing protein [Cyclobacteriaceae bacterium]